MFDDTDPRTTGDFVRRLSGGGRTGDVVLVGVVHDHPASAYRVRTVVDAADPDVLALELPPLAIPLFERDAADERRPPAGDEMRAAIRAATTDAVVGIDGPTPAFLWRLARTAYREGAGLATVRALLDGVVSVTRHAVACRLAATFGGFSPARPPARSPVAHACDPTDDPGRQAADEQSHVRRAEAVLGALGGLDHLHVRDVAREAHMAARLAALRDEGTVVAVVGAGHLDAVGERLA